MKKELIAAVLLAVIFAGVMLNIRASEKIVSSLMSEVDAAYAQLKSGDSKSAAETLDKAIEHWLTLDGYTHIFIRHSEINSTTEAFFQFRSDIGSGDIRDSALHYDNGADKPRQHILAEIIYRSKAL